MFYGCELTFKLDKEGEFAKNKNKGISSKVTENYLTLSVWMDKTIIKI